MPPRTLVTGATGFLGREIVAQLLAENPSTHLSLLVRGKDDDDARRRVSKLLAEVLDGDRLDDAAKRVHAVRADLERDRFGLDEADYERLTKETDSVIHGAASVSFTLPLEEARRINVEGTRRVLDFAEKSGARTDYIGTAYVAGERSGAILEDELDVGQSFRNTYEQTKMEAESLARRRATHQPIAIFRPSIIVGDSQTGRTSSFKVLYWPLKIYGRGLWRIVPGKPDTLVDVVPSDFVVRAILRARKSDGSLGRVFHLCAGPERSARLVDLAALASRFFGSKPAIFVDPHRFVKYARPIIDRFTWGNLRKILMTGRVYTPYLSIDLRFDTTNTRKALEGTSIEVPRVEEYFSTLFRYCIETDWGKRAPSAA
jgi:long-chain acyl-CoA synthetase